MNKRTKFHFQKVLKLSKKHLILYSFIGFLCINFSAIAQSPEGVLDYAEENILLNPNEVVEISERFLEGSNHSIENQCKAYLLKAQAQMFLQKYDEVIDHIFQIKEKSCQLENEDLFKLFLIENQIYHLLDLEIYQKETAENLQEVFRNFETEKSINKQKERKVYNYFSELISGLEQKKHIDKFEIPTLAEKQLTENTYLLGTYLFLQAWEKSQENEAFNFKEEYQKQANLADKNFDEIYYKYFALYEAQKMLIENEDKKAHKLLNKTLREVDHIDGLSYYKRKINAALIKLEVEEQEKELVIRNRNAELNNSSEIDLILTNALTKVFSYKTALNIEKQTKKEAEYETGLRIVWFVGGGIIIAFIFYFFRLKWLKKHYSKIAEFIEKINLEKANVKEKAAKTPVKKPTKSLVSKEAEEQILSGLEKFEKEEMYLQKNISLAYLANELKMNTKYLSEVLNSRLNENFNGYINRLRIEYIVNKLKNDPQHLKYKISYLAEISGYNSHSSFSTAFKSVTGMPPTKFISYLKRKI